MIESRCGIVCSACEFKNTEGCGGCIAIANPFWGSCPVKACCEGKKLACCGSCENFPCPLLTSFAYDKEQGDEGRRIEQCKVWCQK